MKALISLIFSMVVILAVGQSGDSFKGAWERKGSNSVVVIIYADGFFSASIYDLGTKAFIRTYGGKYTVAGNTLTELREFDTRTPDNVGKEKKTPFKMSKDDLTLMGDEEEKFKRLDNGGPGDLAGAWLITGRYRNGELSKTTPGARRTMKILSGTRFQWIAYNVDTKEFSGTGGGSYTTVNGKYTESIEFFSRDNTRVGMSLTFDYTKEDGDWRHKGLSSKGEPIDEVWTLRGKIGL